LLFQAIPVYFGIMKLTFDTLTDVLAFADQVRKHVVPEPGIVRPGSIDPAAFARDLAAIARGNRIAAIKAYRAVVCCGLKEAKEAIDAAFPPRPPERPMAPCGDPECGCAALERN
jgi:hypothetical protein